MIEQVLRALEGVRKAGDGWVAKCPAHDDRKASLSVKDKGPEEWPLLNCFVGCTFDSIREALEKKGVKAPERKRQREQSTPMSTTRYEVRDPDGVLIATKVRRDPGKIIWWELPNGNRGLRSAGIKTDDLLFGSERLKDKPAAPVVICEGEKAASALQRLGVACAVGTTGGAEGTLSRKALEPLRGREVFLWPDNDPPGEKHMARIRVALAGIAKAVYTIRWQDAPPKGDAADWMGTLDEFNDLADDATVEPAPEWSVPFSVAMGAVQRELDRRILGNPSRMISSGIEKLDEYIGGGFKPGEVYLWGAPTGGGKSTIMQSIAINVATGDPSRNLAGERVLLVSPEMTLFEIGRRAVVRDVGRPIDVWRSDAAAQPFLRASARMMSLPIILADKVDITMPEIVAEAFRLSRDPGGLGLVIVDYAQQVVDDSDPRARYLQVGDVADKAVVIAKTLDIPVLVASQVNRTVPDKRDAKPVYSFRESQKLEHKASVVLIFDRREAFDPDAPGVVVEEEVDAKILCLKNRLGPQFRRVEVIWKPGLFRITDGPWLDAERDSRAEGPDLVTKDASPPDLPSGQGVERLSSPNLFND